MAGREVVSEERVEQASEEERTFVVGELATLAGNYAYSLIVRP